MAPLISLWATCWSFLLHLLTSWGIPSTDQPIVAWWLLFMLTIFLLGILSALVHPSSPYARRHSHTHTPFSMQTQRVAESQQQMHQAHLRRQRTFAQAPHTSHQHMFQKGRRHHR